MKRSPLPPEVHVRAARYIVERRRLGLIVEAAVVGEMTDLKHPALGRFIAEVLLQARMRTISEPAPILSRPEHGLVGYRQPAAHRFKISQSRKGMRHSEQSNARRSESMQLYHALRRAAQAA